MKSKIENDNIETHYFYNAQNKLCRRELDNGDYYEFLYDSQNRRIALSSNGIWRKIIHDENLPIVETDCTNVIVKIFVRGLGIAEGTGDVIAEYFPFPKGGEGDFHYYLANHCDDTILVLDIGGTVENYFRYKEKIIWLQNLNIHFQVYVKYINHHISFHIMGQHIVIVKKSNIAF